MVGELKQTFISDTELIIAKNMQEYNATKR